MLLDDLVKLTERHRLACRFYRDYTDSMFTNDAAPTSLADLPYLPVRAFKQFDLKSVPDDDVYKIMRSSGTSGSHSRIFLDRYTAKRQTMALGQCFAEHFGPSRFPMLVIDCPKTVEERLSFSARTAGINGFSMFSRGRCFALDDDMKLDLDSIRAFLDEHTGKTIFLFGFTSVVWADFLNGLEDCGDKLNLENAFLLHGGGWKKLENERVTNDSFKARIQRLTGCSRVHNYYGMVEQTGTIFIECDHGNMHAAAQSDVITRDPATHCELPHGETGLIQVFSSIQESYPGHSILTEDVGRTRDGASCGCGRTTSIVEIDGRLPRAEVRGCSDAYP